MRARLLSRHPLVWGDDGNGFLFPVGMGDGRSRCGPCSESSHIANIMNC